MLPAYDIDDMNSLRDVARICMTQVDDDVSAAVDFGIAWLSEDHQLFRKLSYHILSHALNECCRVIQTATRSAILTQFAEDEELVDHPTVGLPKKQQREQKKSLAAQQAERAIIETTKRDYLDFILPKVGIQLAYANRDQVLEAAEEYWRNAKPNMVRRNWLRRIAFQMPDAHKKVEAVFSNERLSKLFRQVEKETI
jgi:hypothetical protein